MKACPNCGKKISEFALYCPFCGNPTTDNKQINSETVAPKTVINQSAAKTYRGIGFATVFSAITALLCFLAFLVSCSIFMGTDAKSAVMFSGRVIFLRSLIVLGISCIVFIILSKSKKLSTTGVYIIATIVCAAAHFGILCSVSVDTAGVYAWQYHLIKAIIPVFAITLGVGISVLQGCLCIVAHNGKAKSPTISFGIVIAAFIVFFCIGAFVGVKFLRMGVSGGFCGSIGTLAAIVATVVIQTKKGKC